MQNFASCFLVHSSAYILKSNVYVLSIMFNTSFIFISSIRGSKSPKINWEILTDNLWIWFYKLFLCCSDLLVPFGIILLADEAKQKAIYMKDDFFFRQDNWYFICHLTPLWGCCTFIAALFSIFHTVEQDKKTPFTGVARKMCY